METTEWGHKAWEGKEERRVKVTAVFLIWVSGVCWGAHHQGGEPEMDGPLMLGWLLVCPSPWLLTNLYGETNWELL